MEVYDLGIFKKIRYLRKFFPFPRVIHLDRWEITNTNITTILETHMA